MINDRTGLLSNYVTRPWTKRQRFLEQISTRVAESRRERYLIKRSGCCLANEGGKERSTDGLERVETENDGLPPGGSKCERWTGRDTRWFDSWGTFEKLQILQRARAPPSVTLAPGWRAARDPLVFDRLAEKKSLPCPWLKGRKLISIDLRTRLAILENIRGRTWRNDNEISNQSGGSSLSIHLSISL